MYADIIRKGWGTSQIREIIRGAVFKQMEVLSYFQNYESPHMKDKDQYLNELTRKYEELQKQYTSLQDTYNVLQQEKEYPPQTEQEERMIELEKILSQGEKKAFNADNWKTSVEAVVSVIVEFFANGESKITKKDFKVRAKEIYEHCMGTVILAAWGKIPPKYKIDGRPPGQGEEEKA